jgi:bifunctional UDP-N-acetylglucosamine pyrophosphorylase/glucosamine-1-phosphate N-acetyltransferase
MPVSVVILAAGQGKRMNSDLPKVLQPLAGRPLLAHVIASARALSPDGIFVVYGHGGAQVQAAFPGGSLDWVLQAEQLGTGHAVMQAMPMIADGQTVLVLYGDVPLIGADTLRGLLAAAGAGGLALLTLQAANPHGYGRVLRDALGAVTAIVEQRDATAEQLPIREVFTGLLAAPAAALKRWLLGLRNDNAQGEFYLTDVVAAAVRDRVTISTVPAASEAEVTGVNDKLQLAEVEAHHRRLRARELLLAGATLADPARVDVRGEVSVGRDVVIDVNVIFEGRVVLGDRVTVGPNCILREASIGADTDIQANSLIDHAVVGDGCRIGPFARLRPDTRLEGDVHIGNFVEVKASQIGAGSKANHLSYVGDSVVGSGVNIGAGSITCNYDGANKWPTIIEDGAFIGSGTMMVAPVRIGAGSTVGAGSTITAATPAGQLTLARAQQTTIEGWQRPAKLDPEAKARIIRDKTPPSGK